MATQPSFGISSRVKASIHCLASRCSVSESSFGTWRSCTGGLAARQAVVDNNRRGSSRAILIVTTAPIVPDLIYCGVYLLILRISSLAKTSLVNLKLRDLCSQPPITCIAFEKLIFRVCSAYRLTSNVIKTCLPRHHFGRLFWVLPAGYSFPVIT